MFLTIRKLLIINTILLLILTACLDKSTEKRGSSNKNNDKEVVVQKYYAPLTGLEVKDDSSDNRVIAVMLNNHNKARPQSGLVKSDIVYELLAEGDITRLLAIYQSNYPEVVGPIRSARDYYIELANGFNALYICHGNSPEARNMLDQGVVDNLNGIQYDGVYFKRDKSRYAPHNSYTGIDMISSGAKKRKYSLEGPPNSFNFLVKELKFDETWTQGEKVTINYSRYDNYDVTYTYNSNKKAYERSQGGQQTIDREEGPVYINNVVSIITPHEIQDSSGRRNVDLTNGGEAYMYQQGMQKKVQWANDNGIIKLYESNVELPLLPGKTWVNFIPDESYLIK
jgi:hypothetical protein